MYTYTQGHKDSSTQAQTLMDGDTIDLTYTVNTHTHMYTYTQGHKDSSTQAQTLMDGDTIELTYTVRDPLEIPRNSASDDFGAKIEDQEDLDAKEWWDGDVPIMDTDAGMQCCNSDICIRRICMHT
jgi:hypothetical protein